MKPAMQWMILLLVLHSGSGDITREVHSSTAELGESEEAAMLLDRSSRMEDTLLRSTQVTAQQVSAELARSEATPWEVLVNGPTDKSPMGTRKWLARVKEAAHSSAERDSEQPESTRLVLLQQNENPQSAHDRDKEHAKAALNSAQQALTDAALAEIRVDSQLADLSASIQAEKGNMKLDKAWRDMKQRKVQAQADFGTKEKALQDAFTEAQKYEEQQANMLSRSAMLRQRKHKLQQAKNQVTQAANELQQENEALGHKAAQGAAHRFEAAGLSPSWVRANGRADIAVGEASHNGALEARGEVELQEAADVEAGRQPIVEITNRVN